MTFGAPRATTIDSREGSPRPRRAARNLAALGLVGLVAFGLAPACASGGSTTSNAAASAGGGNDTGGNVTGAGGNHTGTGGNDTGTGGKSTTTGGGGEGGTGGAGGAETGGGGGQGGAGGGNCTPKAEKCNGVDDDCDGEIDNGNPEGGGACPNPGGVGICANGTFQCQDGALKCVGNTPLPGELCNGKDDNCDGKVDEDNPEGGGDCVAQGVFGECQKGSLQCKNGAVKCVPGSPQPEVCDGLDNNCDSFTDEGILPGTGMQCNTNLLGQCAIGVTKCEGATIACVPSAMPVMESCNGKDDDCDGQVDEDIVEVGQDCNVAGALGICQFGKWACTGNQLKCNAPLPGTVPETCNGKDDDCDGKIDNSGKPEICNGLDDDCNGVIDDVVNINLTCGGQVPGANNVSSWLCGMGACKVKNCDAGFSDVDAMAGNGCECSTDTNPTTCAGADAVAKNVAANGLSVVSGAVETAAGEDWIKFTFVDKAPPVGGGAGYHPQVVLTNNAAGQYKMDVLKDCNTVITCGVGTGTGVNTWEMIYDAQAPGTYVPGAGCCSDSTPHVLNVYVRITRVGQTPPTCDKYTVTAKNL